MTPPDLDNPAERDAYRRELRDVAKPLRYGGVALALAGVILSAIKARIAPGIPGWLPLLVITLAILTMLAAVIARARHHLRRMRGA
jgi:hypothetical protein